MKSWIVKSQEQSSSGRESDKDCCIDGSTETLQLAWMDNAVGLFGFKDNVDIVGNTVDQENDKGAGGWSESDNGCCISLVHGKQRPEAQ